MGMSAVCEDGHGYEAPWDCKSEIQAANHRLYVYILVRRLPTAA